MSVYVSVCLSASVSLPSLGIMKCIIDITTYLLETVINLVGNATAAAAAADVVVVLFALRKNERHSV